MYEISILPDPEIMNGKPMYFWCIMGKNGENRYNCGHGWSESITSAAEDANNHYQNIIRNYDKKEMNNNRSIIQQIYEQEAMDIENVIRTLNRISAKRTNSSDT